MTERGRFISLEGGEGAGKSTQGRLLAEWLREQGLPVRSTREPGGSRRAEVLRELLLAGNVAPFGAEAEALVFALARADHLREMILPALDHGVWVVTDRFSDSTWAYQGAAGVSEAMLRRLDSRALGGFTPDLTLILDVPPELGLRRIRERGPAVDRFEADPLPLHQARRKIFLDIAAREPERCVVVDAGLAEPEVARRIREAVAERLLRPVAAVG